MEKKISKKTLSKSFHHWYYGNLTCFSQEHMQTFGYLTSMLPIIEELYDKKEDQANSHLPAQEHSGHPHRRGTPCPVLRRTAQCRRR